MTGKYLPDQLRWPRLLASMLVFTLLSSCTTAPPAIQEKAVSKATQIIKSPNDDRDYRYLELSNRLKVVLISDPGADKAAASLSVFRGNFDDPLDRPGLAHFLEHMLFIGTEKYPEPDAYHSYIRANGGRTNAYTAPEHTNYFFDIKPDAFREGLDRFAQFFIAPLFQQAYVDREKNAVDSEYRLRLKDDGWRGFMISKITQNSAHPVSSFNIGTLESLDGDVRADLLRFFEEHYSANQMSLVILSNETLDQLEPWVRDLFGQIRNRNLENIEREPPLYADGQLPATLRYDNIKDSFGVSYTFPAPSGIAVYRKKPSRYISNLVGHEGEGSLHKLLSEKGWINLLSAGAGMIDEKHDVMTVSIELTPEGAMHIPEITGYLFAYLDMLRSNDIESWIYEEQAKVAELGFRFAEKTSAISVVESLSPELEHYPAQDLLIAPYLMEEFDEQLIREYLEQLTPDRVVVAISSPGYKGSKTEKWFNVSYDLELGEVEMADIDSSALALPAPNPFLPESLELVSGETSQPTALIETEAAEIFLGTDIEFGVPRAVTHVSIRNPGGLVELADVAAARLYAALVQDDLNALAYPALLAGVSYQIAAPPKGFRVSIGGYHDKQLVLLEEVLPRLTDLAIDQGRFAVLKDELLRDLQNARKGYPYQQVYGRVQDELLDASWTPEAMIPAVELLSVENLTAWRNSVFSSVAVQALLVGNITASRADDLAALLKRRLRLSPVEPQVPVVASVSGAASIGIDIEQADAAMVLYVQDDDPGFETRAKSALLTHLIASKYYSSLRTEQQLGYVVYATNTLIRDVAGISFIVQSPVAAPEELRRRTLEFFDGELVRLAAMPEEEFDSNKGGLISSLTQKDRNLSQRANRYWFDLDIDITTFDSHYQIADEVARLTLDEVQSFAAQVKEKLAKEYVYVYSEGKFGQQAVTE